MREKYIQLVCRESGKVNVNIGPVSNSEARRLSENVGYDAKKYSLRVMRKYDVRTRNGAITVTAKDSKAFIDELTIYANESPYNVRDEFHRLICVTCGERDFEIYRHQLISK